MLNLVVYKVTTASKGYESEACPVQNQENGTSSNAIDGSKRYFLSALKPIQTIPGNTLNNTMTASLSTRSFSSFIIIQSGCQVYRNKQGAGQPKNRGSNADKAKDFTLF
jgi:hypothetical protein